jgi:hypothetical protein
MLIVYAKQVKEYLPKGLKTEKIYGENLMKTGSQINPLFPLIFKGFLPGKLSINIP